MKICFLYKEDYPWDVRVEKIVKTLAAADHEVTLVARNLKRRPRLESAEDFTIRRLPAWPGPFRRLDGAFSVPLFFNPVWFATLARAVRESGASVIIVRDLPLMPLAIGVGAALGCRVVFDMAECYPEMYRSIVSFSRRRLRSWLTKNPAFASWMERFSVARSSHVMVMIEESRDRLLRMGFDAGKISIVSNTPARTTRLPRTHEGDSTLRLLYVGFVTRIRGLNNLIHGIRAYVDAYPDGPRVEFDAVGKGAAIDEYRTLAERLGVASQVRFHGWCEQDFVDELYARSDVGVLTYRFCPHWNHTIPNKLFDYMQAGMPVLATDVRPIRRIVEEVGCGVVFPDGDAQACGEAIARLTDAAVRAELGRRGHAAVEDRYNWEHDGAELLRVIDQLA